MLSDTGHLKQMTKHIYFFFSLCEHLLISILFFSLSYFTAIHLFFLSLCYSDEVFCQCLLSLERVFYFIFPNLTMTARFS